MFPCEPLPKDISTCRVEFKNGIETRRANEKFLSIGRELNGMTLIEPRIVTQSRFVAVHVDQSNGLGRSQRHSISPDVHTIGLNQGKSPFRLREAPIQPIMSQRKCRYKAHDIRTGGFSSEHVRTGPVHMLCLTIVLLQLQGRLDREHDIFVPTETGIVLVGDQRFRRENRFYPGDDVR